jgi:hypothetical protein
VNTAVRYFVIAIGGALIGNAAALVAAARWRTIDQRESAALFERLAHLELLVARSCGCREGPSGKVGDFPPWYGGRSPEERTLTSPPPVPP